MRILPLMFSAVVLSGCGSSEKPDQPRNDTPPPRSSAPIIAEIQRLEDTRAPADQLFKYLEDADSAVRRRAVVALGRIGDTKAVGPVAERTRDEDSKVAEDAVFALGLLADPEAPDSAIAEPLRRVWDSPSAEQRALALFALSRLGRPGDLGMAEGRVTDPSPRVRQEVAFAILRMSVKAKASDEKSKVQTATLALKTLLRDPDNAVRWRTAAALAKLDASGIAAEIEAATLDQDALVRAFATRALGHVATVGAGPFIRAAGDADPRVAWEGVDALSATGRVGDEVVAALEKAASGGEPVTIARAIEILGVRGRATPGTIKAASRHPSTGVRAAALVADARMRGDKAFEDVVKQLSAPQVAVKRGAVEALVVMGGARADGELQKLFAVNGERILQLQALFSMKDAIQEDRNRSEEWDGLLEDALAIPDFAVRATVPDVVGKRKAGHWDDVFARVYHGSSGKGMEEARAAILAWFEQAGTESGRGREIANEGLKDPSFVVREQAVKTLEAAGVKGAKAEPDPPAKIVPTPVETMGYSTIVKLETDRGEIRIRLLPDAAPAHCSKFVQLVRSGYYDGKWWHRVEPNFVIQGGDPRGDGYGDVDFKLRDECSREPYDAGTIGMAKAGKDTGSSQLFITSAPAPHLEWRYTVFGRVESGLDVVRAMEVGDRILKASVER